MKHWIVMFRPETYALAREHGLMGALNMHYRRFAEIKTGDRFVAYISRDRLLDAHGVVTSEPFQEVSDVPKGWIRYTERVRIRFDATGAAVDARDLLWGLSACEKGIATVPANLLFCKGGFMEITPLDYEWLTGVLKGEPHNPAPPSE